MSDSNNNFVHVKYLFSKPVHFWGELDFVEHIRLPQPDGTFVEKDGMLLNFQGRVCFIEEECRECAVREVTKIRQRMKKEKIKFIPNPEYGFEIPYPEDMKLGVNGYEGWMYQYVNDEDVEDLFRAIHEVCDGEWATIFHYPWWE
jgi:hypothetical protein